MVFAQMAPSLSTALATAGITALFGIIVFVLGQFIVKLVIDPLQEQARAIGEIAHALVYYAHVGEESSDAQQDKAREVYRDLAAGLRMSAHTIPLYRAFALLLPFVPAKEAVHRTSEALIGLSNNVGSNRYEDAARYRQEIKKNLGID